MAGLIKDRQGYGFPPGEIYQGLISKQLDLQIHGGGGGVAGGSSAGFPTMEILKLFEKCYPTSFFFFNTSVIKCV